MGKTVGLCGALLICTVMAQEHSSAPVQLQGTLNVTAEAYTSSGESPLQRFLPRYGMRLFFRPIVRLFGQVEVPFDLSLAANTGMQVGAPLPFQQPFNQFGMSPQLTSWLRLHGGYFSLRLSELSFGDVRVLGGGLELSPGILRLKSFYGVTQHPRPLDTLSGFFGVYRRWAWGGTIGIETEGGTQVQLHYVRSIDDTASIRLTRIIRDTLRIDTLSILQADTIVTPAEDNAVVALSFRAPLAGILVLQGETALSAYSSSIRSPTKDFGIPDWLFRTRYSTNVDAAAMLSATLTPSQAFSLTLGGRWFGPGFRTLGYPQLQNDIAELTAAPRLSFANNTVTLHGSVGLQRNNLRSTRLGTTWRFIGSVGLGWQASQTFGLNVNYANYGMRMQHSNDTLRVDNIYHSASLAPRWTFSALGGTNVLTLNYSFSETSDRNPLTNPNTRQQSHAAVLSHALQLPSTLGFMTLLSYTVTRSPHVESRLWMLGETLSYGFIPGRLTGSAGLSLSTMHTVARDLQWGVRLGVTYSLREWGTLNWNAFLNRVERSGRSPFTEVRLLLGYGLNL